MSPNPLPYKLLTVVVGIPAVVVGMHSHFKSIWNTHTPINDNSTMTNYQICTYNNGVQLATGCPDLALEIFYVAVVATILPVSIVLLLVGWCYDVREHTRLRGLDTAYHVVASMLLIAGSVCYFVSTEEIDKLTYTIEEETYRFNTHEARKLLLRTEKLAAAALSTFQGLLCAITAIMNSNGKKAVTAVFGFLVGVVGLCFPE